MILTLFVSPQFHEMYKAYKEGRAAKDPSEFWYKGEMGFFDYYIIPLANKLKKCGVFGVSYDEYIGYAMKNRAEWELRGKECVEAYLERYKKESHPSNDTSHPAVSVPALKFSPNKLENISEN